MITFQRNHNRNTTSYFVYNDDMLIGSVTKKELWVVRGTRIIWEAYYKGRYIGNSPTRKEAALWLESRKVD